MTTTDFIIKKQIAAGTVNGKPFSELNTLERSALNNYFRDNLAIPDIIEYSFLRIERLEKALEVAQADLLKIHIETNDISKNKPKSFADKIKEHVNNPVFQEPISETYYIEPKP